MHRTSNPSKAFLFLAIAPAILALLVLADSCRDRKHDESRFKDLLAKGKSACWKADTLYSVDDISRSVDSARAVAFDTAITILREAIALNPGNAEAHYFLGNALWKKAAGLSPGESIPERSVDVVRAASEQFETVLRTTPAYEGELMNIGPHGKLMSQWSTLALAYAVRGETDSARWAMEEGRKRGGFTDAFLEFGRNLLASCDSNSILVTAGDMDSFPVMYLQLMQGMRRDVLVVTCPLVFPSWYRAYLMNPAPFSVRGMAIDTMRVDGNFPPSAKMRFLDVRMPVASQPSYGIINVSKDGSKAEQPPQHRGGTATLRVRLFEDVGGATGLLPTHQLFVNWLRDNAWRRPVIVSPMVEGEDLLGLEPHLRRIGLVRALVPGAEADSLKRVELGHSLLMMGMFGALPPNAGYSFAAVRDTAAWRDPDLRGSVIPLYLNMYKDVYRAVPKTGRNEKGIAKDILQRMWRDMPVAAIEHDAEARRMVESIGVRMQ